VRLRAPVAGARVRSPDQLLLARAPALRRLGAAAARAFVAGVCRDEFATQAACAGAASARCLAVPASGPRRRRPARSSSAARRARSRATLRRPPAR